MSPLKIWHALLDFLDLRRRIGAAAVHWFSNLTIGVFSVTFFAFVVLGMKAVITPEIRSAWLEGLGVALSLLGAMWSALGVHLPRDDRDKLIAMTQTVPPTLDTIEVVRMFKAASNFATSGSMMIFLGAIMLLIKTVFFH